jgi:8-oxo-dGTP diphosphatase
MSSIIKVVAAIIYNEENRFLMALKKAGKNLAGYWEFPGGKVEKGEEGLVAIEREIKEELNVTLKDIQYCFDYQYLENEQTIDITFFRAQIDRGNMVLTDHDEIAWMNELETHKYNIAPADLEAIKRITIL